MIQLRLLSGKQAGVSWTARRFPVRIGRSDKAHLRLEEPGVWDQHATIAFQPRTGFVLATEPDAPVLVNEQRVSEAVLRNGDTLSIGSIKAQFWLGETRQRGLRFREWLTWAGIAAVTLGQVALVYWLLQQV